MQKPEQMFDEALGGNGSIPQIPHWLGNILWVVVSFLCKVVTRYTVHGREHVRAFNNERGAVIACNHSSYLDIPFMYCCVRPQQWVRIMARDTLFKRKLGAQILARCGGFPVARDTADRTSIKRATRMLKSGQLVGIFPEGTRRGKTGRTPEIHGGAALIARMGKAPIVPMAIDGSDKVKVKGDWRIHFPKVNVYYGAPIAVSSFDFLPKEERLDGCMWYVMRESFAMKLRIPAEQVDMTTLFPDAKDYSAIFKEHPIPRED